MHAAFIYLSIYAVVFHGYWCGKRLHVFVIWAKDLLCISRERGFTINLCLFESMNVNLFIYLISLINRYWYEKKVECVYGPIMCLETWLMVPSGKWILLLCIFTAS